MSMLVVDESLVDIVRVDDGPLTTHVGGSPLNVAVGLTRLGVATTFASQVGHDRRGQEIVDRPEASGVALSPGHEYPAVRDLEAADLEDLLSFGAAAAAVTCSRPGADPPGASELPTLSTRTREAT